VGLGCKTAGWHIMAELVGSVEFNWCWFIV
jgi:hypothetical protein